METNLESIKIFSEYTRRVFFFNFSTLQLINIIMPAKVSLIKIIGKNLLRIRKEKKMSQEQLAYLADIDTTYIGYIENSKYNVTIAKLQQIAEVLEVSVSELINEYVSKPEQIEIASSQNITVNINSLMPCIREYQRLADEYGINNIFYNKGGKLLQVLLIINLKILPDGKNNIAIDELNNKYKVRLINIKLTRSFSTHHHMNPIIINKYRKVHWIFAIYQGIELVEIYKLTPVQLEPFYKKWETKWHGDKKDINNPKIPLSFVKENGELLFRRNE